MSREDDEKDSCGEHCPYCKDGRCIKGFNHRGRSNHVCSKHPLRHTWR